MGFLSKQLRDNIIIPSLKAVDNLYSENAVELLMATCAHESHLGKYVIQVKGPAVGIYQMEPNTHDDIWKNYMAYRKTFRNQIKEACAMRYSFDAKELITNLKYATIMARVQYFRAPDALPNKNDIDKIWEYYKKYWNSKHGAAKKDEFIGNYKKYVKGGV